VSTPKITHNAAEIYKVLPVAVVDSLSMTGIVFSHLSKVDIVDCVEGNSHCRLKLKWTVSKLLALLFGSSIKSDVHIHL